ncbi:MAG: ComF family protein [Bacteroidales bacterium]|nr:ComF family protein [Bacteroidales bacterium]
MIKEVADIIMPRQCLVCGRTLGLHERHLCIWCASDLPFTYYWEHSHNTMAGKFNGLLEKFREDGEAMDYSYATALLFYHGDNPYKEIPRAVKYHYNISAGRFFASLLGRYMSGARQFRDVDAVIPVPLHWLRRRRRGYNQAEVIAAAIARELGAQLLPKALVRRRRTSTQTRLDAASRLQNVRGVFRVRQLPEGLRHVLLVDDTFTTGATLATCYLTLRPALGTAVRISVATLSVVDSW